FSDHHVPSINHYVPSINYHVPSTYHYTASTTSMYSDNMWVENPALEAQMWMQQGTDGNFLDIGYDNFEPTAEWAPTTPHDSAPTFSFDGFPFTSDQWSDQLPTTSSITPGTASFDSTRLFNIQEDSLAIPSSMGFSEQLPFWDGFDLGAEETTSITDACDNWEKFCAAVTSMNSGCPSSHMPDDPASRATPYSLPLDFNVAELLAPSTIHSSAMESSPGSSFLRFPDDSENCEPSGDLSMYEVSESEVATAMGWDWTKSDTVWLENDVSSEITHFPEGFWVSSRTKIFHLERVTGLPSQIPIPVEPTGFLINLTDIPNLGNETVDATLKDQTPKFSPFSSDAGNGNRLTAAVLVPNAAVVTPVNLSLLNSSILNAVNSILALGNRSFKLNCALARDRTIPVLAKFSHPKKTCKGGHAVLKKLEKRLRNKDFILLCSNRDMFDSTVGHRNLTIPDHIDQDFLVRAMTGEKIVEDEDQQDQCCRISSSRQGKKGKMQCPFNHIKEGRPFPARVVHLSCEANLTVFIPHEDKYPELARMCIVVPDHEKPHRHPVPPPTKVTHAVAEKYKECVRKYGLGATVGKVEKALSTREILGTTPSLYHPALLNRDTKQKLINQVKDEGGSDVSQETQIATYIAKQQARPPEERYIHSIYQRDGKTIIFGLRKGVVKHIHTVRTLDCDTTFKPVKGKTDMYEINGWLMSVNESVTLGRVWMDTHDRSSFKFVWEELQRLVKRLTNRNFGFVALHQRGTLLGVNGDMEAAAVLGLADAMLPTIDIPQVAAKVRSAADVLKFILRICFAHLKRGIPELPHLPHEDHQRISNFMYLETPTAVEEFKVWIKTLPDPDGTMMQRTAGWWSHKLMHEWILPGCIQCLSGIDKDTWNIMEATTNLGEAQHKANNAATDIQMGMVESFIKYEEFDKRREAEIELMLKTGNVRNPRNDVVHRYDSRNKRGTRAVEKTRRAHSDDEEVQDAKQNLADAQARLKLAQAEQKANSSGRVRVSRPRKRKRCSTSEQPGEPTDPSVTAAFVEHDTSASVAAAGPSTVSESQTEKPAHPPRKRLKLGPLKGWGIQRDGVEMSAVDYAQNYWEEFKEEYPEYVKAVLLADSDE
ncbi:hypothetical protein DFH08DRAFT_1054689, partial [Mycena albidolilacea]